MVVNCETKTKDNVFVTVKVAVQFQVNMDDASVKLAAYRLTNPAAQIESYVFGAPPHTRGWWRPQRVWRTRAALLLRRRA